VSTKIILGSQNATQIITEEYISLNHFRTIITMELVNEVFMLIYSYI